MTLRNVPTGAAGRMLLRALTITVPGVLALGACAAPAAETEGPAKAALSAAETAESPTSEVDPDQVQIDPEPSAGQTPSAGQPWDEGASAACQEVVAPGLGQVAQSSDGVGVTTFWSAGETWAVCDVVAGEPTVVASAGEAGEFDKTSLALSSAAIADGGIRYTAGGLLPWPVQELAYSFPDQHTAQARFVSSDGDPDQVWWVAAYTATQGPLATPGADPAGLGPVTITVVGGAAEAFRFSWDELQRSE